MPFSDRRSFASLSDAGMLNALVTRLICHTFRSLSLSAVGDWQYISVPFSDRRSLAMFPKWGRLQLLLSDWFVRCPASGCRPHFELDAKIVTSVVRCPGNGCRPSSPY